MKYEALMKDLTESKQKCCFCDKPLNSLKAYILKNKRTDKIVFAGPKCAAQKIDDPLLLSGIPDFTRHTMAASRSDRRGRSGGSSRVTVDKTKRDAREYLILREDKLAKDINCSYSVLKQYYDKSRKQDLSNDDLKHIKNIEAKAPERLSLSTLQKMYNYLFWIDVGIEKLPPGKKDFLEDIRAKLIKYGRITPDQKMAVNKWLKNIDGIPQLK